MNKMNNYEEFCSLVEDILSNEHFNKLDLIEHHGTTRKEHCIKVAYNSFLVGKKLRLDTKEIARAGLLHDFFMSYENFSGKERFLSFFTHPKYAAINAKREFTLSDKEINIIEAHMFPVYPCLPKYAESWIICMVDKVVAAKEFITSYNYILKHAVNYLYIFLLINLIRTI